MGRSIQQSGFGFEQSHDAAPTPNRHVSVVELLLTSGGDERLTIDPVSGRNRYGPPPAPAGDEIWFSSSTASAISEAGFNAARDAYQALHATDHARRLALVDFFNQIRGDITKLYGTPGSDVVLSASGTEGELMALALVGVLTARPITNIVVGPHETGSGVVLAANGCHFADRSCLGGAVPKGQQIADFERYDVNTILVPLRRPDGAARLAEDLDMQIAAHAQQALLAGRSVLLHVLDVSKTGLSGLSRKMARALTDYAPGNVFTMVDACQLRCAPRTLRADLGAGFMTLITGSKFAAGPPFSGALMLPPQLLHRLVQLQDRNNSAPPAFPDQSPASAQRLPSGPLLPSGLAAYSARLDWPEALRGSLARDLPDIANLGLGLRWCAALAELQRLAQIPSARQDEITDWFHDTVSRFVRQSRNAKLLHECWEQKPGSDLAGLSPPHDSQPYELTQLAHPGDCKSLIPICVLRGNGAMASLADVRSLHLALQQQGPGGDGHEDRREHDEHCAMHVGQPVDLGGCAVLRVCLSAPMISDIAEQMALGATLQDAVNSTRRQLASLFEKWDSLAH